MPHGRYSRGRAKVGKVMGEFKEGVLHSGGKSGPTVTDRKQAVAIAMSEAGMSRKKKAGRYSRGRKAARGR